ncbi:TIGR04206 family protein [Halomicroarcula sp. S1AR25-4]|uniref:TIGR04206 family protein n=1 Tax=Haloarcula sp. S1AR25-4 TaxID=2950538 RepID=UPI00287618FE|nr:TIGR04206 family protein [Halomicroarcula sp. S1AR25-4]MDS0280431.1 TIGR04206 family protein [Halomicroarcula sp. S1AR25-4]
MVAGPRRRLVAVVVAGLVPWTVLVIGGELTMVFTLGLFNANPPQMVSIYDFFFRFTDGLPQFIESWGTGVLLYLLALGSALSGVVWREDHRITALALVGAGLSQIGVAVGFNRRIGYVALPVGTVVLLGLAWWYYWPLVRPPSVSSPAE